MQSSALRRGLALAILSFLSACGGAGRAVFDPTPVPDPPSYTADFKRELAREIDGAPRSARMIEALTDASQYYDRIRRLKGGNDGKE